VRARFVHSREDPTPETEDPHHEIGQAITRSIDALLGRLPKEGVVSADEIMDVLLDLRSDVCIAVELDELTRTA
jgi:hypothetical protein